MRKDTSSTLLTISAAVAILLLASPLVFSNLLLLLQPVQASSIGSSSSSSVAMNFRTTQPANGTVPGTVGDSLITFDAKGTKLLTPYKLDTNGAYQITSAQDGKVLYSGPISRVQGCCLTNDSSSGQPIHIFANQTAPGSYDILISTVCSTSASNHIDLTSLSGREDIDGHFQGSVECSPQGGNTTSTTTTTTTQQQEPSSSNRTGNQTR